MTCDEAMKVWLEACERSNEAWFEAGEQPNDPEGDAQSRLSNEAAATVIQQAFAERDGENRMALQIIANPDWTWATVAEMREIARQALAAKGDSRG